jgi:hypothetical protein
MQVLLQSEEKYNSAKEFRTVFLNLLTLSIEQNENFQQNNKICFACNVHIVGSRKSKISYGLEMGEEGLIDGGHVSWLAGSQRPPDRKRTTLTHTHEILAVFK